MLCTVNPRMNPRTVTLLPRPSAIVKSSASVRPGRRTRPRAEYRISLRKSNKIDLLLQLHDRSWQTYSLQVCRTSGHQVCGSGRRCPNSDTATTSHKHRESKSVRDL